MASYWNVIEILLPDDVTAIGAGTWNSVQQHATIVLGNPRGRIHANDTADTQRPLIPAAAQRPTLTMRNSRPGSAGHPDVTEEEPHNISGGQKTGCRWITPWQKCEFPLTPEHPQVAISRNNLKDLSLVDSEQEHSRLCYSLSRLLPRSASQGGNPARPSS